jgi:hypothetical protein
MGSTRAAKLDKVFQQICNGNTALTAHNGPQFLESVYTQGDAATCLNRLATSRAGKESLRSAVLNMGKEALNGPLCELLVFLQRPGLSEISNGDLLKTILQLIAQPIFWHNFHKAYLDGDLNETAQVNFAWLLHHLVSLPAEQSDSYRSDPDLPKILQSFLNSKRIELRTLGHGIKHVLAAYADVSNKGIAKDNAQAPPGGRHDNDFPNFRDISIVPTSDEVASKVPPFLRPSGAILDPETESSRVAIHLDNQFRLLREDMVYELREELHPPQGRKRRSNVVHGLQAINIHLDTSTNRRMKYGIQLQCDKDLPWFKGVKKEDRMQYAKDNFKFLKHQSLACLLLGTETIAFVTISRDEDLLSKEKPIIVVHLEGKEGTLRALRMLKEYKGLTLLQIDTALFAYEFVLKALKEARGVPLSEELLFWKENGDIIECSPQADVVVDAMKRNMQVDLQPLLKTKDQIILDGSQAESFLVGLTRRVSLIQGPPGT